MASVSSAYYSSVISYIHSFLADNKSSIAKDEQAQWKRFFSDRFLSGIVQTSDEPISKRTEQDRVDVGDYIELLDLGERVCDQPLFGFHLGKSIQIRDYGALGYLVENCENLSQAIDALQQFDGIVADIGKTEFTQIDKQHVGLYWYPVVEHSKNMILRNTTAWVATVRKILNFEISPSSVSFTFDLNPNEVDILEAWFNCKLLVNQATNCIEIPKPLLSIRFSGNQALYQQLHRMSLEQLSSVSGPEAMPQKVRRYLAAQYSLQNCDQSSVAEHFGMTTRTLQRRLKSESTSFLKILTHERKHRLARLLSAHSAAETAFLLGFKEQSSFSHAVKKWFGVSPSEYQKQTSKQR